MGKKLFDFCVGNPPYHISQESTSDKPIYHEFMDSVFEVAEKVELITPSRFLFNAGKTPKAWNEKMLNDEHFKVCKYFEDATKVFPNTMLKGGVAITYHDSEKEFGSIKIFTDEPIKNSILNKCTNSEKFSTISDIVYAPESYKFTKLMHEEHPELKKITVQIKGKEVPVISNGHDYDITSNIFDKLENIVFYNDQPSDGDKYISIIGRKDNERCSMWIKRQYIAEHSNLEKYKVLFPKSNGNGKYGERLHYRLFRNLTRDIRKHLSV